MGFEMLKFPEVRECSAQSFLLLPLEEQEQSSAVPWPGHVPQLGAFNSRFPLQPGTALTAKSACTGEIRPAIHPFQPSKVTFLLVKKQYRHF